MQWSGSKTMLAVSVVILMAVFVSRMRFAAYSVEEVDRELSGLCTHYDKLYNQKATKPQWKAFAVKVREQTEPLVQDMEEHMSANRPGSQALYQLAKYALPRAVASNGSTPPWDLRQWVGASRQEVFRFRVTVDPTIKLRNGQPQAGKGGVDWITWGIVAFDLVLLGGLGYTFLKPPSGAKKPDASNEANQALLQTLNHRIEQDPNSVRYHGVRARILVEMGRREEALIDIDWILDKQPHGVDLEAWRRLRATIATDATAKK